MTKGIFDNSLKYHMTNAKNNGVTAEKIAEIITHLAFYVGVGCIWLAKEVWTD
jgi:4-carboxymuconolactone decarboxylase